MVASSPAPSPPKAASTSWVRRALGPFWGFQEAWLSLAASVFDMALYPVIFVRLLSAASNPSEPRGHAAPLWALAVVARGARSGTCAAQRSSARAPSPSSASSIAPFVILVAVGALEAWHGHGAWSRSSAGPSPRPDIAGAISVTLWNYMGWDNASTVAQEVDDPQRNYPRAMLGSAAMVAATYILPLLAVGLAGLDAAQFSTGAWTDAARLLAGPALALAVVLGE